MTPRASGPVIRGWLPCWTLWRREVVRFCRQPSRIIGALGTPLVFWVMAGAGLGRSFSNAGSGSTMSYLEFTFPGAIASILLFTAIFSTISIIDDRREGFMQTVLVAPVPRASIVLGKVMGATTLAVGQALIFLLLAPVAGIPLSVGVFIESLAVMVLLAFSVTCLGFFIAWRMETTQGFHAIMNLFLIPMLVLSGAFFPPSGSSQWLRWIVAVNPMTYGVTLLRCAMYHGRQATDGTAAMALAVSLAFGGIMFWLTMWTVTRESARAAQ